MHEEPERTFASFQTPSDWQAMIRSEPAVWLDNTGLALLASLQNAWKELPVGGFLGGPSWGSGPLPDGRFVIDSRSTIESFRAGLDDASELFLGSKDHPCWMIFKTAPKPDSVLLISGCDSKQMNYFGRLTQRNHEYYTQLHQYENRWHHWEPEIWGTSYRELVWAKLKVVADALAEGKWDQVWWIDADVAFLNMRKKLDRLFHPAWDAVFTDFVLKERPMISSGIFGARKEAEPILREVWENGSRDGCCNEENALTDSAEEHPELWKNIQAIDHRLLNSIYNRKMNFRDPAFCFTCHMVNRTNQQRRKLFWEINQGLGI